MSEISKLQGVGKYVVLVIYSIYVAIFTSLQIYYVTYLSISDELTK